MPEKDLPTKRPRANYGAREEPRYCSECGWEGTRVYAVQHEGAMIVRQRQCYRCRARFATTEQS